ncbi:MAG: hypothetical protein AABZ08_05785 [Planctomycetota bacterium]
MRMRDRHWKSVGRTICVFVALYVIVAVGTMPAMAQPHVINDLSNDAILRRTDAGNNDPFDPQVQRLPDIIEMRLGGFAPVNPATAIFQGMWSPTGGFMRFDLVLDGLINPPGPVGYDDLNPIYNPLLYGPSPIYGFVEFDIDADENTGGELDYPYGRYLGNVARFGGLPHEPYMANRAAEDYTAFDDDINTAPFVDRSGEEFHLTFLAEDVSAIYVRTEKPGGNPSVFESGEVWDVDAEWFHRAHGWEPFLFQCWKANGRYKPDVSLRFAHDTTTNTTTISLVYPLTNGAMTLGRLFPCNRAEPNDGCPDNENSILEALTDLQFSAANPVAPWDPNFQLLSDWATKVPANYLTPESWRMSALVGSAYAMEPLVGSHYVWTDVWPNPRYGDFNGDCQLDAADTALLNAYIETHDGQYEFDDDGVPNNNSILLHYYAGGCCVYDTDYNGTVSMLDLIVGGDMNLNHVLDIADLADFVEAMLDPVLYSNTHLGQNPVWRGDLNCDDRLDGLDIQLFVRNLTGP